MEHFTGMEKGPVCDIILTSPSMSSLSYMYLKCDHEHDTRVIQVVHSLCIIACVNTCKLIFIIKHDTHIIIHVATCIVKQGLSLLCTICTVVFDENGTLTSPMWMGSYHNNT